MNYGMGAVPGFKKEEFQLVREEKKYKKKGKKGGTLRKGEFRGQN